MSLLSKFHADFQVRDEVKDSMLQYLRKQAADLAFKGEPTTGIMEARKCVEGFFRELERTYGEKKLRKPRNYS